METKNLGFIGGGRITKIILHAFNTKSVNFDSIIVFEPNSGILHALKNQFPDIIPADSAEAPAKQDIVILAIHPPAMMETLNVIKDVVNENTVILSLAPKITIDRMAAVLPTQKIARMIPNATTYINEGYNPISYHNSFLPDEKKTLLKIFEVLGYNFEVIECKLESYAIISAMLPTYFWFQWEKMEDIGIKMGFTKDEASQTIKETIKRSIGLFYDSGLSKTEVIDLIPVKPIGEKEEEIKTIYDLNLLGLFEKIKP